MNITDKVSAADSIEAGLAREKTTAVYPCPRCGRETKEHIEDRRICSHEPCRAVWAKEKAPMAAPHERAPIVAYPCPKCGKETKEHTEGRRICSAEACREIVGG